MEVAGLVDPAPRGPGETPILIGDATVPESAGADVRPGDEPARQVPRPINGGEETTLDRARRAREFARNHGPNSGGALVPAPVSASPASTPAPPSLEGLAARIRSKITGLGQLLAGAVDRKLELGRLLIEAKAGCHTAEFPWPKFLDSCDIKERNAREAIQFFENRGEIEELKRNGGTSLTVNAVRQGLTARSRKGVAAEPDDPARDGDGVGAPDSHPLPDHPHGAEPDASGPPPAAVGEGNRPPRAVRPPGSPRRASADRTGRGPA